MRRRSYLRVGICGLIAITQVALGATSIPENVVNLRDPFKRPAVRKGEQPRTPLEFFAVDKFKLIAVITGPDKVKAALRAPNDKTYFVNENMPIGLRKGVIYKITPTAVLVREHVVNVLGQEEEVDSEIPLQREESSAKKGM